MIYPRGSIIEIKDFPLPQGPKDKYFIVIDCIDDKLYSLLAMTTTNKSGFYFDLSAINLKYGSLAYLNEPNFMFCFPADFIIGINSFYFWEDTFLLSDTCFRGYVCDELEKLNPNLLDTLKPNVLNDLVYCLYRSNLTKYKYKKILENVLVELNPAKK